jgi:hypothetical protein
MRINDRLRMNPLLRLTANAALAMEKCPPLARFCGSPRRRSGHTINARGFESNFSEALRTRFTLTAVTNFETIRFQ